MTDVSVQSAPVQADSRFSLVDGLRGIAALLVVVFHAQAVYGLYHDRLRPLSGWPTSILQMGHVGVQIFFVISGFVMAHALRATTVTPAFVAHFALRRSLRLDPTYWTVLVLTVLHRLVLRYSDPATVLPSFALIATNAAYLQGFLQVENIVGQAWTLCIEVQFYLFLVLMVAAAQRLGISMDDHPRRCTLFFFIPGWVSLFLLWFHVPSNGLFIFFWYMFYLGVLAYWTIQRHISPLWLVTYAIPILCLVSSGTEGLVFAVATSALLVVAGRWQKLSVWLSHRSLQFLGAISYSLYLSHSIAVGPILKIIIRHVPDSVLAPYICIFVPALLSIPLAYLLYVAVERPTLRLARRVRLPAHA